MKSATVRKATSELTALIEQWLEAFHPTSELPHLPDDVAYLMAQQAVHVLEILHIQEHALAEAGLLKEE